MKLSLPLSLLVVAAAAVPAIAATVKGRISDAAGEPLTGAVVRLIPLDSLPGLREANMLAGAEGDFDFQNVKPGKYMLEATFLGMDTIRHNFVLPDSAAVEDFGTLKAYEKGVTLSETVVTAVKTAVVAKQDTIEFNAGSFKTQANSTVEDLLKKLPGVEVGSDGSISSGGKSVTKILIDGKEFFNDDPKMATKNLPSDMVEKVQVVDRKSDLARLTGVDDGEEETVINLTVKKDRNNGWFGNVMAAGGTDKRYKGSFIVNRFQDGNQITLLGGMNNVNDMGFSDGGAGRFHSFGGSGGILTSGRLGLNFNVGNGEKFRVGGNVMYSYTDRDTRKKTATQYLFPDSVSYFNELSSARDKGHNLRADFRMQWKIDDNNTLEFRPRFSMNFRKSESSDSSSLHADEALKDIINSSTNFQANKGTSWQTSGELIYNHNFPQRPGRSFSVWLNYSFSSTRQYSTSLSDIIYYLAHDDDEALDRYLDSKQWNNSFGGRLTWTEPLGNAARGNFLTFGYKLNYKTNNADKYTYNLDESTLGDMAQYPTTPPAGSVLDEDLSNRFRNRFLSQEVQIGYKKVNSKYNLEAGIVFAPSQSESTDLINSARNIPTRHVWNVAPFARFRYKFSKTSALSLNYRARTSEASMSALQPVADVTDPLHIIIGNPSLKPTFTQSIRGHFNDFKASSQQSVFAVVSAQYSLNTIVNKTVTDPTTGVRTTTYANANGDFSIFGMGMLSRPLGARHWRMSAHLGVRYSNSAGYINGDFNRSGNLQLQPRFGVTYTNDWLQITATPAYSFGLATNSLERQPNRTTHTYGFTADATLTLPFGLIFSTDVDFSAASGYLSGFNTTQWLWNAELSYSLLRDKSLTISVSANDILGQRKSISRTVSANQISDSRTNDLTRYVMFGIAWKFNTLGKGKSGVNREVMPEDRPPLPGREGMPSRGNGGMPVGPPPGRGF